MILDLHVHTVRGSSDSSLKVDELTAEAERAGLDGLALTEHRGPWERHELEALRERHTGLLFVNAMEVETFDGHLTVFGLDRSAGIHDPIELRRIADAQGAVVVMAHPFRYYLGQPERSLLFRDAVGRDRALAELADHPIFALVDAIEVHNGGTAASENALALEVARYLGKPTVGGSDAHSTHGLGRSVTVLPDGIRDAQGFMEALRAGRVHAALRDASGTLHHLD
ncbi:MAG: CehA/McbA family metallohydrolase [Dehalococcoidia bacterium]